MLAGSWLWGAVLAAQGVPVPRPFPGAGQPPAPPPTSTTPQRPPVAVPAAPPQAAASAAPTDQSLGIPGIIPPRAQFLESFDAGRGQQCYIVGTNAGFPETVAYYKQLLRDGGRELFKSPAMQQFDIGKFQEQTMAYPPSVVVKDYAYSGSEGYLHVTGTKEERFATVIQIVPAVSR